MNFLKKELLFKLALVSWMFVNALLVHCAQAGSNAYCDSICGQLVSNGQVLGVSGDPWSETDDQWCATNGQAATSGAASPGPYPLVSAAPTSAVIDPITHQ